MLKGKQYRKRKEIYQIDLDIQKEQIKLCDETINKIYKNKKIIKGGSKNFKPDYEILQNNHFLYITSN